MKGRGLLFLGVVLVMSFVSGGWLLQRGNARARSVYEKARLFEDVLSHIADYHVDSLSEEQLYDLAIEGLLGLLDDPYASYLDSEQFGALTERTTGQYGGLGMQIDVRDGWITVIAPIADTPAEAAGIESGDRIIEVEGVSTFGWKNEQAVLGLRGEPGTQVRITVERPGVPESMEFSLTRAIIHVRAVRAALMLDEGIGYVSLAYSTIGETVVDELRESVDSLRGEGAHSLVLDLRDNPGGLLSEGVRFADMFLEQGDAIVETRGRTTAASQTYTARSDARWPDMPLAVLVNGGTASAAEIIAGAIQDHDRGVVLGTPTFGKGLVQTVFRLGPEEGLQLTTGRWYTPSGRTIQRPVRRVGGVLRIVGGYEEEREDRSGDSLTTDSSDTYYTDAGRPVIGGGGIRPDITVRLDTLSAGEQEFMRALGSKIPEYRDVLTSYSLEVKGEGALQDRQFSVTPRMRAEVIGRLKNAGVGLSASTMAAAADLLDRQIAYEITRYVFGRDEETRRRIRDDEQVQTALELLRGVQTTGQLIERAAREPADR